jgi:hypothetical protein
MAGFLLLAYKYCAFIQKVLKTVDFNTEVRHKIERSGLNSTNINPAEEEINNIQA